MKPAISPLGWNLFIPLMTVLFHAQVCVLIRTNPKPQLITKPSSHERKSVASNSPNIISSCYCLPLSRRSFNCPSHTPSSAFMPCNVSARAFSP